MKILNIQISFTKNILVLVAVVFLFASYISLAPQTVNPVLQDAAAACTTAAVPTTFGVVTQTVNVATAGTYRVWSRIKAPNTTANSYYFEVDGGCAYNVGNSAIPVNTWTWVNYQDGSAAAPIDITLTAGAHTLTYTGKEADVQLDKVMLLGDLTCVPTGFGDNCAVTDTVAPAVSVTSPATGATVTGVVNIATNASDASGVTKVNFLVDNVLVGSDTTTAYAYAWDSKTVTNGAHTIIARAFDAAGNIATSTAVNVTVSNTVTTVDSTPPVVLVTAPTNGSSSSIGTAVAMSANATDAVGVTKVEFYQSGILVGSDTTSPYSLTWNTTGATAGVKPITAKAYDAAGNVATSAVVSVTLTSVSTVLPGDVNLDSRVNALDLSSLISHDGQNFPAADFNKDGIVGAADIAILLSRWTW